MTSLQLKHGFGKTSSGNMNKKQQQGKFKQIQLGDYDIEMLSPQFLQSKTLKKPLRDYTMMMSKTSDNFMKAQNDITHKNPIPNNMTFSPYNSMENFRTSLNKTQKIQYTFIGLNSSKDIKPAYKPVQEDETLKINTNSNLNQFVLDDKNTVFSAILKKGQQVRNTVTFADVVKKPAESTYIQNQRKVGKAENKLKQLFNKNNTQKPSSFEQLQGKKPQKKQVRISSQIDQQINESINEYGEDGFQHYSSQSGIKQSIREQFGASSGSKLIKESIRQEFEYSSNGKKIKSEIGQEIQQSIKGSISASKDNIPQFIASYKSSKNNIRQQIAQQLSGSKKSVEEVYQEIFQEYDDSLKNSKSVFKKSTHLKQKQDVLSKSFRMKTNLAKSIKFAQQINQQHKIQNDQSYKKNDTENKYTQKLEQEKKQLQKKKIDLNQLLGKRNQPYEVSDKNKNLTYEFRIELNKLLTSENFESKLRKLTSFINFGESEIKNTVNSLEDKILNNILSSINQIKKPEIGSDEITKLKKQYDEKLNTMLKDQEINLRVEMDKKLHEKDMQLKKMIAELQKKFQGKAFSSVAGYKIPGFNTGQQNLSNSGLYEMESDYSIDSDNISWKADLWQVLPQYEKRKLYEKQTKQVTNFLTDIMMNELKQESLSRGDLDISFVFPDEFNDSSQTRSNNGSTLPKLNSMSRNASAEDIMPKSAFNRKEFQQNIPVNHPPKKESIFPDFQRPKQTVYEPEPMEFNKKQSVNQYSKIEGEIVPESTKKLKMQKQKILQILSKYKSAYNRKKNDAIRKILKTLKPKDLKKVPQQILSVIQQITILGKEDINQHDLIYVRAYEQELVWALTNVMMKNDNKKTSVIEEEMRKNYDRLVVICQAKVAESAQQVVCLDIYEENKDLSNIKSNIKSMQVKCCPLEIAMKQEAVQMIQKKGQKNIKNQLVDNIISALMTQFAKQFPKKKK